MTTPFLVSLTTNSLKDVTWTYQSFNVGTDPLSDIHHRGPSRTGVVSSKDVNSVWDFYSLPPTNDCYEEHYLVDGEGTKETESLFFLGTSRNLSLFIYL